MEGSSEAWPMKGRFLLAIFFAVLSGMVCPSSVLALKKVSVFVSILPQRYFVEKIGGDLVDVSVMVKPGANPATYEPKPNQMVALSEAKLYFSIGVPFEKVWMKRFSEINPTMAVVSTDKGIEKLPMKTHRRHGEAEGPVKKDLPPERGTAHNGPKDPHIWLAPHLVTLQARNILMALEEVDPVNSSVYEFNFRRFLIELIDLDAQIRRLLSDQRKRAKFMVFHPAWGYFADAYGLEQIPIEVEGKEPRPQDLKGIVNSARDHGIRVIFAQPQFSTKSAETIAKAVGGKVVFADPLAHDWAENLREQAAKFRSALNP
jgi:zinc transport system substrate-binding protein